MLTLNGFGVFGAWRITKVNLLHLMPNLINFSARSIVNWVIALRRVRWRRCKIPSRLALRKIIASI